MRGLAALALFLALALPGLAEGGWEEVAPPATGGVYLTPCLEAQAGRIHLFWAGTNPSQNVKFPEVYHASSSEGEGSWTEPRAPFFGENLGKVRTLDVASTNRGMGLIFQRQMEQSETAFEIQVSFSGDNGWSLTPPLVVDSYVAEDARGTSVAIAGVEGIRPGFAGAWVTEGGSVRAAVLDLDAQGRPTSHNLGVHDPASNRVVAAGDGKSGFLVAWLERGAVRAARLERLSGEVDGSGQVLKGSVASGFDLAPQRRDIYLVAAGRPQPAIARWDGGRWREPAGTAGGARGPLASALDGKGGLHVLLLDETANRIDYLHRPEGGAWSAPVPLFEMDPQMALTGFDIVAGRESVWAVATQGLRIEVKRLGL